MAGTKRERSPGVWELRVQIGRDPLTGKYKQHSETYRGTKIGAGKALAKLVTKIDEAGEHSSSATFSLLLDKWLALTTPNMSPLTVDRYRIAIDKHIKPALGDRQVRRLHTEDFDIFYSALRANMAPASVSKIHGICSASMRQAVRWGWIAKNPTAEATKPKIPKANHELPPINEVKAFLSHADAYIPELGSFLRVSLALGTRRGETIGLRRSDIDWKAKTISINSQVVQAEGTEPKRKNTKWDSRRSFAVGPGVLGHIKKQTKAMDERAKLGLAKIGPNAYIWSDDLNCKSPWRPNRVTLAFIRARTPDPKNNWPGIKLRLHDLRHLNGTHLSDMGMDPATIAHRLGHSRVSTTVDYYVQRVTESDRKAADLLGELLD